MLDADVTGMLADRLQRAWVDGQCLTPLAVDGAPLGVADGYAVQNELLRRRIAEGDRMVGYKAAFTSLDDIERLGTSETGFGFLSAGMACPESGILDLHGMADARVEAGLGFVTRNALTGDEGLDQVMGAIDYVVPTLAVLDHIFAADAFDLASGIAANCLTVGYLTGSRPCKADGLDLHTLGVVVEKCGNIVALGAGAAVLGHPARVLGRLAKQLAARAEESRGDGLPAGSFVVSGGIAETTPVRRGDNILVRFQGLGTLAVRFV